MGDRESFYARRDQRSIEYGAAAARLEQPVGVIVGEDAAESRSGQVAALALINMLARVHREIHLSVPSRPLLARPLVRGTDLEDTAVRTIAAIDPFCRIRVSRQLSGEMPVAGLGTNVPRGLTVYLGALGSRALTSREPIAFAESSGTVLGAGLAACLGASDLFRLSHGLGVNPRAVSVWDLSVGNEATTGPPGLAAIDAGNLVIVGAGAVASGFAYWTAEIQRNGAWTVLDGDVLKLHNTNRGLSFLAADSDWMGGAGAPKAQLVGNLLKCDHRVAWYDQWIDDSHGRADLVLPLANERNVRHAVGSLGQPVVFHATTSTTWQAQLHRHIADRDDCIVCRMREVKTPSFGCSSGFVPATSAHQKTSSDAALPFLSGAAGLMLAAALLRFAAGEMQEDPFNFWTLHFDSSWRVTQRARMSCGGNCAVTLGPAARAKLNEGRRWARLK